MKWIFLIILPIVFSCKRERNEYIVILPMNDTINIKSINWNHHENRPGKVLTNLYIELENYSKIYSQIIPSIKLKLGNNIYSAKGVAESFSRETPKTDFIYFYHNKTRKIVIDTVDNRQMILIWPENPRDFNLPKEIKINNIYD